MKQTTATTETNTTTTTTDPTATPTHTTRRHTTPAPTPATAANHTNTAPTPKSDIERNKGIKLKNTVVNASLLNMNSLELNVVHRKVEKHEEDLAAPMKSPSMVRWDGSLKRWSGRGPSQSTTAKAASFLTLRKILFCIEPAKMMRIDWLGTLLQRLIVRYSGATSTALTRNLLVKKAPIPGGDNYCEMGLKFMPTYNAVIVLKYLEILVLPSKYLILKTSNQINKLAKDRMKVYLKPSDSDMHEYFTIFAMAHFSGAHNHWCSRHLLKILASVIMNARNLHYMRKLLRRQDHLVALLPNKYLIPLEHYAIK